MQAGELVVARISGGLSIGRLIAVEPPRVRLAIGRNREAKIPLDRIILGTGLSLSEDAAVEEFRQRCTDMASSIDLTEVWEVVRDEGASISLDDLAELYWGAPPDAARRVALLLHLEQSSLYFAPDGGGYAPRTQEYVQDVVARRQREAENARASDALVEHLSRGQLPSDMTSYQTALMGHLRSYAIHGDNYTRSAQARALLERIDSGSRDLQRRAFELLVGAGAFSEDEPLEIEREGIVEKFSADALAEAASIDLPPVLAAPQRRDLTALPATTIDDSGTEDRDDALSLEIEDGAPTYRVGIHIADAGALILPGSALDQEADRRMATLYTPDRKVTMLPPALSNNKGSLVPGEKRAALSLLIRITNAGDILEWEAAPSIIQSRAALSYEEVDAAIADVAHPYHEMLAAMDSVARSLKGRREKAGAVNLDRPEMTIKVTSSGEPYVKVVERATPSRQLVTEFMVLCNTLLAEFCRREDLPAAYRSQPAPQLDDLGDMPDGPLRWFMIMRRFAPSELGTTPLPHSALGVPAYIQVSSPLRRYPDLVMQRQISHFLNTGRPLYSAEEIASVAQRAEVQLRELGKIEDERMRYWFLKHLKLLLASQEPVVSLSNPGQEDAGLFKAIVLENQPNRTALLELADYPFRVRAQLPNAVAAGETVTLRLHGVDLWRRIPHFVHER